MKRIILILTTALTASAVWAQDFKSTTYGLRYAIIKDNPGERKPVLGDYVELHMRVFANDSMVIDSRSLNGGSPAVLEIINSKRNYDDLTEGLKLMTAGDSAVFLLPVDTMNNAGLVMASWMKPGTGQVVKYEVSLVSVKTKAQHEADLAKLVAQRKIKDDETLKNYFKEKGITPKKTASGLYYNITKEGTGIKAKKGQKVTLIYTGKLLDGTVFDSNIEPKFNNTVPLTFDLGKHQVIEAWEEAVTIMGKGTEVTLFVPSHLAYGAQAKGIVKAHSVLVFDIQIRHVQ